MPVSMALERGMGSHRFHHLSGRAGQCNASRDVEGMGGKGAGRRGEGRGRGGDRRGQGGRRDVRMACACVWHAKGMRVGRHRDVE